MSVTGEVSEGIRQVISYTCTKAYNGWIIRHKVAEQYKSQIVRNLIKTGQEFGHYSIRDGKLFDSLRWKRDIIINYVNFKI